MEEEFGKKLSEIIPVIIIAFILINEWKKSKIGNKY